MKINWNIKEPSQPHRRWWRKPTTQMHLSTHYHRDHFYKRDDPQGKLF